MNWKPIEPKPKWKAYCMTIAEARENGLITKKRDWVNSNFIEDVNDPDTEGIISGHTFWHLERSNGVVSTRLIKYEFENGDVHFQFFSDEEFEKEFQCLNYE